ncbi:MAG: hypothetical protein FIB08_04280 [Candidatus Methanoperedens sp.]|nr:hypothetical protein [Candidatus Methanoperedens sp.]
MSKKITAVVLAALMLLIVALPVSAQISTVEIRGTVSRNVTDGASPANANDLTISTWNATNFAGFWYDLKENKTSETLKILTDGISGRTVAKEKLWYNTTKQAVQYKVAEKKNRTVEYGMNSGLTSSVSTGAAYYATVGWLADKYVGINGKNNKLAKLVVEQAEADKKTLAIGETWDLGDGYTLTAQSIDAKASPRQAWLVLSKDGNKLDDKIIEAASSTGTGTQGVYTYYAKSIAGESNVPIFVTYVDSVFAGATSDMVQLKYTWLISSTVTEVKSGDKFGIFKVDATEDATYGLTLKSDSAITLSSDGTNDLLGNIKFRTADNSSVLRFYPIATYSNAGTYEIRGAVSRNVTEGANPTNVSTDLTVSTWNADNFAGFWYDLKENKTSETLKILSISGRTIPKETLWYNTSKQAVQYKVAEKKNRTVEYGMNSGLTSSVSTGAGYYATVGWLADKYVGINGKNNKLAKLVVEQAEADKKTLAIGETWDLGDGYTLTAQSIDAKASPRQAWLVLSKDGNKLDDKIIEAASSTGTGTQGVYTYYAKSIAGESNVPIFVTYVDSVFAGATSDMVQLKYTWLISSTVTEVKSGDKFGIFKVDATEDATYGLTLKSDSAITLSSDGTNDLLGNIKFRTADNSSVLRFYPKVDMVISGADVTPTPTTGAGVTPKQTVNVTAKPTTTGTLTVTEKPPEKTPTTVPAATTPKEPGFELAFAIAGLLAVAYLVLRQRK